MTFKIGDKVRWTSSAAGVKRTKQGTVVEIVPPRMVPQAKAVNIGRPRLHVSYVVRAFAQGTETESKKLYWPYVVKLELIDGDANVQAAS